MKLYGFWRALATCRVQIALNLKGIPFEEVPIDLVRGEQQADNYKAVNPQAVVPALVIDDDDPLFQSMAIIEYLGETYPKPSLASGWTGASSRTRHRSDHPVGHAPAHRASRARVSRKRAEYRGDTTQQMDTELGDERPARGGGAAR